MVPVFRKDIEIEFGTDKCANRSIKRGHMVAFKSRKQKNEISEN